MKIYYFEKLDVWQNAKSLSVYLYGLTSKFPSEEKFGITNQIRRASTGIAANIAEGTGRNTGKDQRKFLNLAYSSALEVLNFLLISYELNFISDAELSDAREKIELITTKSTNYIRPLRSKQLAELND